MAGEQLSEYQILQGLLLPSAGNFAEMLATWDLGNVFAIVVGMNARASALLLDGTALSRQLRLDDLSATLPAGTRVGTLVLVAGSHQADVPLVMAGRVDGSGAGWRLTHGL